MRFLSPILLLLCSAMAFAEVRIEGDLKVDKYKLVRLTAGGDITGAALIWDVTDEDQIDADDQAKAGRFNFVAPPGQYRVKLRAIRIGKDGLPTVETARATVVIGDGKPVPPIPPNPPGPPDPPNPAPILTQQLQFAFAMDTGSNKAAAVITLSNLLGTAVEVAKRSGRMKTAMDFQTFVKASTDVAIGPDAIPKTRIAIGGYISSVLPTEPSTPADEAYWLRAQTAYSTVSEALKGVK